MAQPRKTEADFWSVLGADPDRSDQCWEWSGRTDKDGYGTLNRRVDGARYQRAHRLAYRYGKGAFPLHLAVLHHCDNPPCCNPNHLFLGTAADNNADMIAKGRGRVLYGDDHPARRHPEWVKRGETHYMNTNPIGRAHAIAARKKQAKVTDAQVAEMRAMYAAGGWTFAELGERYGISTGHAHAVVRRRFRTDVA